MKKDNKELYESIMRNVSKLVKKALNEDRYGATCDVPALVHSMTLDLYALGDTYIIDVHNIDYKDKRVKYNENLSTGEISMDSLSKYGEVFLDKDPKNVIKKLGNFVTEKLAKSMNYNYTSLGRSWLHPNDYDKIPTDINWAKKNRGYEDE